MSTHHGHHRSHHRSRIYHPSHHHSNHNRSRTTSSNLLNNNNPNNNNNHNNVPARISQATQPSPLKESTKEQWQQHFSKSGKVYYYNKRLDSLNGRYQQNSDNKGLHPLRVKLVSHHPSDSSRIKVLARVPHLMLAPGPIL